MATDVVMPQMGESIAEGTIVRWIKKVGDAIDRDEPLFEISTDKVDAEIPSPASGVIAEIRAQEGETVPVNSVVAVIAAAGDGKAAGSAGATAVNEPIAAAKAQEPPRPAAQADGAERAAPASAPATPAPSAHIAEAPAAAQTTSARGGTSTESALLQRSSPLVRRIAREHNVDIAQIKGSGIGGRVTKEDILAFVEGGQQAGQRSPVAAPPERQAPAARPSSASAPSVPSRPVFGAGDVTERMSPMRKKIAEHMVLSRRTSAHVHSVFEVNFSRLAQIRDQRRDEFERAGTKLTYMSFITKAVVDGLREVPIVNSSIDGDSVIYHKDINIGIAVALDWGLIVPVIKSADEKNLVGLSRAIIDLASRARSKQLKPEEVGGGTFTITNPGVFGALFGTPIINQPQVAILGVGNVEKRPVVVDDAIAIRPMAYLTLGYDHRIIDGAVADRFMSHVKKQIENWDPAML
jgi:pyruvate dehydrogenase E2 component (dihydrolipoyllysine-residue acetyltransferase)